MCVGVCEGVCVCVCVGRYVYTCRLVSVCVCVLSCGQICLWSRENGKDIAHVEKFRTSATISHPAPD